MSLPGKNIACCTILGLVFSLSVYSQDVLETLDGEILQGKATIKYQEPNDIVIIDGVSLDATEIKTLKLEEGKTFIPAKLTFFNKEDQKEYQKVALMSYLEAGTTSLMSYEGDFFDYALIHDDQVFTLQNTKSDDNTYIVKNYRFLLLQSFQECVSRREIFQAEFKKETLINLTKRFNLCKANKFSAFKGRNGKFRYNSFSFRSGINHFSHSLKARVPAEETGPFYTVTSVDQTRKEIDLAFDIIYQSNLPKSRVFYYHIGIGYQRFSIDVEPVDDIATIETLSANEFQFYVGVTTKFLPANTISPYLSLSGFSNLLTGNNSIYSNLSESYPVISKEMASEAEVGILLGLGIEYRVNDSMLVSLNSKFINSRDDDPFTDSMTNAQKRVWNDLLTENWILTFGYTYEILKTRMN